MSRFNPPVYNIVQIMSSEWMPASRNMMMLSDQPMCLAEDAYAALTSDRGSRCSESESPNSPT
eukprot:6184902-Pleurochrysis_carterae.AAC.4